MVRTVFFGTPEFAVPTLEALVEDSRFEVVHVISQPDRPAGRKMRLTPSIIKARALELGLPVTTPEKCNTPEFLEFFKTLNADLAVVVAFGQILPQKLLDVLDQKFVNLHGSLLPRWRGAAPIQRSIMEGDLKTGVSLQVMVKKLDAGAVISEVATLIEPNENAISLHDRLSLLGARLVQDTLPQYCAGEITPTAQDESLVTYAHKIEKSESEMDWNLPAKQIHQNLRGLALGPGAFCIFKGKKLKIHRALVISRNSDQRPGCVSMVEAQSFSVQTGEGQLQVLEVQPESRSKMDVKAFMLGNPLELGLALV